MTRETAWEQHLDRATGAVYWFNSATGDSSWIPPLSSSLSVTATPQSSAPDDDWVYVDSSGRLQGPFPASVMRRWCAQAMFDEDTLVKRVTEPVFMRLIKRFPEPRVAFL